MFPFRFFSLLSRISQQYLEIKLNFQELDKKDFLSMFRPSPTKQLQTNSRRVSSIKFAQLPTTLSKRKHRQTSSKYQSVPEMHYPWQRKQKTPSEKSDGSIVDKSRAMFTECKMSPRAKMLLTLPVRAYLPNINPPDEHRTCLHKLFSRSLLWCQRVWLLHRVISRFECRAFVTQWSAS